MGSDSVPPSGDPRPGWLTALSGGCAINCTDRSSDASTWAKHLVSYHGAVGNGEPFCFTSPVGRSAIHDMPGDFVKVCWSWNRRRNQISIRLRPLDPKRSSKVKHRKTLIRSRDCRGTRRASGDKQLHGQPTPGGSEGSLVESRLRKVAR